MANVIVHPRVHNRHPEINDSDVVYAWENFICRTRRTDAFDDNYIAVGFDLTARILEMVAVQTGNDAWFVFHAMPATPKALIELGLM
ncbi:MAG: hypothetical protein FWC60_11800 [Firmicutes bacterium]|nr:hypothetical protein [Bacillota bacterium]